MEIDEYVPIEIPIDLNYDFKDYEIYEAKFNNLTRISNKVYDSKKYKIEDKLIIKNDKNDLVEKDIPVTDYIRFKYVEKQSNEDGQDNIKQLEKCFAIVNEANRKELISNAKIVEWSDNTYQLIIGDQYFDLKFSNMENVRLGLSTNKQDLKIENNNLELNEEGNIYPLLVSKPINKRIILTSCEYDNNINIKSKDQSIKIKNSELETKVKLAYSFYDKNKYKKDDFGGKYGAKKQEKSTGKKRNRPDKDYDE
jgi:hypothetical protein